METQPNTPPLEGNSNHIQGQSKNSVMPVSVTKKFWPSEVCPLHPQVPHLQTENIQDGISLVVQWLTLCLPMQEVRVQFLVRELVSCILQVAAKNFKKQISKHNIINRLYFKFKMFFKKKWKYLGQIFPRSSETKLEFVMHHRLLPQHLHCIDSYFQSIYIVLSSISQRRQWLPTPVLLPGKSHGWRSLVGCSPWGR